MLKDLQSVGKNLQKDCFPIVEAQDIFNAVMTRFDDTKGRLAEDVQIGKHSAFKRAIR